MLIVSFGSSFRNCRARSMLDVGGTVATVSSDALPLLTTGLPRAHVMIGMRNSNKIHHSP